MSGPVRMLRSTHHTSNSCLLYPDGPQAILGPRRPTVNDNSSSGPGALWLSLATRAPGPLLRVAEPAHRPSATFPTPQVTELPPTTTIRPRDYPQSLCFLVC